MRQTTHFLATLLFMVGLAATCQARQNNDRQVTTYDFVDFQQLQVSGIVEVHFTQDKHYSISVEESTNPDLMTMVKQKGETLCIWTEKKKKNIRLDKDDKPIVHITAPKLNELRQSGATKTTVSGKLETDAFSIFASGACKCQFGSIYCTDMVISSSGASNISTGMVMCNSLKVNCSGACNIKTNAEAEGNATLTFSGASNGTISFTGNTLKLASSGAGKLNLHVDCLQLIASNSGAAKVSISGTADKTTIKATGVSKINTAELNKL